MTKDHGKYSQVVISESICILFMWKSNKKKILQIDILMPQEMNGDYSDISSETHVKVVAQF